MVTPWDQGMFFFNPSPASPPPKEKNWMPHECMLNLLISYMKPLFPKLFVTLFGLNYGRDKNYGTI